MDNLIEKAAEGIRTKKDRKEEETELGDKKYEEKIDEYCHKCPHCGNLIRAIKLTSGDKLAEEEY